MRRAPLLAAWLLLASATASASAVPAPATATATATANASADTRRDKATIQPVASSPAAARDQARRLKRLSALAALWGEVRYFHPTLATREIDWDRALVDAIPRVEAAGDTTQYRAAIEQMLGVLADPATQVITAAPAATPAAADPGSAASAVSNTDGLVRIDFARLAEIADRSGSSTGMNAALEPAIAALDGAKALVLDARAHRPASEDAYSIWMLNQLLSSGSNAPLLLGALRYRQYNGYVSQTGSHSSGGYSAGLVSDRPVQLPGSGKAPLPPMVVLVNADSALPGEVLTALQASGWARVIAEGVVDFGATPEILDLGEGLRAQVRTTELLAPDGRVGFHADAVTDAAGIERAVAAAIAQLQSPSAALATSASSSPALKTVSATRSGSPTGPLPSNQRML